MPANNPRLNAPECKEFVVLNKRTYGGVILGELNGRRVNIIPLLSQHHNECVDCHEYANFAVVEMNKNHKTLKGFGYWYWCGYCNVG